MNVGDFIETLYEKGFIETLKVDSAITKLVEEKFESLGEIIKHFECFLDLKLIEPDSPVDNVWPSKL